jgi:hypothetical protein
MRKICKCGHSKYAHHSEKGECMYSHCDCPKFKWTGPMKVPGTSKYCQDTPPPTYSPSPEPEPIQW